MEGTPEELRTTVLSAVTAKAAEVSTKRHLGQYIQEETGWYYKAVARVAGEMVCRIGALDFAHMTPDEAAAAIRAAISERGEPFGWGGNWSDSVQMNAVGDLRGLVATVLREAGVGAEKQ